MRAPTLLLLAAPLLALAVPGRVTTAFDIANIANGGVDKRQAPPRPPPCQRADPPPTEEETSARFDKFVDAFVVNKNISEAFTYIAEDYINHNPAARNGAASAWGILSPIWNSQSLTFLRKKFEKDMSWVNYRSGGLGEIVDRFRWEAGCIAEHWDQGERFPSS